jgi:hypothetical protein
MNNLTINWRACLIAVALVLPPTLSAAEPATQAPPPRMLGSESTASCQVWLQERQQNAAYMRTKDKEPSLHGAFMESWVLGFVSGAAALGETMQNDALPSALNDPTARVDADDVLTRTDIYCRGHDYEPLGSAALIVYADLLRDAADRIRARLQRYCPTAPNDPRCKQPSQPTKTSQ